MVTKECSISISLNLIRHPIMLPLRCCEESTVVEAKNTFNSFSFVHHAFVALVGGCLNYVLRSKLLFFAARRRERRFEVYGGPGGVLNKCVPPLRPTDSTVEIGVLLSDYIESSDLCFQWLVLLVTEDLIDHAKGRHICMSSVLR